MKTDAGITIKKVSLSSLDTLALPTLKLKEEKLKDTAPPDRFYCVHAVLFFLGLMHFIPYSFFITANAYWMQKFRNTSTEITDTDARTVLQTHFAAGNNMINVIFGPIVIFLSTFYGHKVMARTRILITLVVSTFSFVSSTIFVIIDTDTWQLAFFILTMMTLALIRCANAAISAANMSTLSKFPRKFMNIYFLGEGCGGVCSATLQVISLAMGTSTEASALFYFISGSSLMTFTLILFYLMKYNRLYKHYMDGVSKDVNKEVISLSEIKALSVKIWSPITSFAIMSLTLTPTLPNVTSLVVSEYYGSGNEWTDKYFVPVITFLYSELWTVAGRAAASKINKTFAGVPLNIVLVVRMIILVPLVYFCNAQPRHYLPVLFPHDWQYIIILGVFCFSTGYITNMAFLDITRLVGPEKLEDALLVMLCSINITNLMFLPIGMFSVDVL